MSAVAEQMRDPSYWQVRRGTEMVDSYLTHRQATRLAQGLNEPWYTTVAFGGNPAPVGPWRTREQAGEVIGRWLTCMGYKAGTLVNAHTIRVYAYATRAQARRGCISDGPGDGGCVSLHSIYDMLPEQDS